MKVGKNTWVVFNYTLKNDNGEEIDSSVGRGPLGYLHDQGSIIPGLKKEMEGKEPGDKFSCVIKPSEGYGEYDPELILDVDRENFETTEEIEVGMQFQVMTPQGPAIVTVKEVGPKTIKIDGNHELAGQNLHFDIEIVEVREPTEEDLNPQGCGGGCGSCCGEEGGCEGSCGSGCGCCE